MENISGFVGEEDPMELPAGFRFHPTDEELISHYLCNKVMNGGNFSCRAIGEVDLNKSEPWELPRLAKMGEKEWYFFCMRDRKYPTGLRTNRATEAGYWKATGKDKEIYRGKSLVGMKKTLVFYGGRAPRGEKSNWVMHEYRLDGRFSPSNLPKSAKNEWVISRVFQKNSAGKKIHISDLGRIGHSGFPPLTEASSIKFKHASDPDNVSCFSNSMNSERNQWGLPGYQENNPTDVFPGIPLSNPIYSAQALSLPLQSSGLMEDKSIVRQILKTEREIISVSQETGLTWDMNNEISSVVSNLEMGGIQFDDQEAPPSGSSTAAALARFGFFWNY